jgi:hypothetical protein
MDASAWLQELERRLARLIAEASATMAASCLALKETDRLLTSSQRALGSLQDVWASSSDLAWQTRQAQADPPSAE